MYYKRTIALLLGLSLSVGLLSGCKKQEEAEETTQPSSSTETTASVNEKTETIAGMLVIGNDTKAEDPKMASPVDADYTEYAILEEPEAAPEAAASSVSKELTAVGDIGTGTAPKEAERTSWTVYRGSAQNKTEDPDAPQNLYLYRLEAGDSVLIFSTDPAGNPVGALESNLNDEAQAQLLEAVRGIQSQSWKPCDDGHWAKNPAMLYSAKLSGNTVLYADQGKKNGQLQVYDEAGNLTGVWKTELKWGSGLSWSEETEIPLGEETPAPVPPETEPEKSGEAPTEPPKVEPPQEQKKGLPVWALILAALGGLALGGLTAVLLRLKKENAKMPKENAKSESAGIQVGSLHNIGRRSGQQDSYDVVKCGNGLLAVVADGMGGLSDGDKVSQKIVATFHEDAARVRPGHSFDALYQMVGHANREVNRMLGSSLQGKCGSTLLAVLLENDQMQWTAVGDSRIYLYRGGSLLQVNREHTYKIELLERAVNGEMSFADMRSDSQLGRVCSYLGMGRLKHVDGSLNMVKLLPGDRVLLMSDGVFNTLSEEEIAAVLRRHEDVDQAAQVLEKQVLGKQSPTQDNFTCVILKA